jgi:hypothetical protein
MSEAEWRTGPSKAEEALAIALRVHDTHFVKSERSNESARNFIIARNVLHEELGYYDERRSPYRLDDDTRDILIVHGRQDSAHALLNTDTLLKRVKELSKLVNMLFALNILLLAFLAFHHWR